MARNTGASKREGARLEGGLAFGIFAVATVISIAVLGFAGEGQTLKGDEWGYAHRFATESLPSVVFDTAPGKYLLVLPMLLYKAAFSTIGISDYLPYRLAAMVLTVAAAALFLILAARSVGYLLALPGAVLILFLGSASEVTTTALRIPEQIAVVAGLGMMLALERRSLRGDVIACLLLVISITSHPLGAGFAAVAAVLVLARPSPERWRRAWVFMVPLVLFAAWYVTLREPAPDSLSLGHQVMDLPRFEFQSLAAMAVAVTGVFRSPFNGELQGLTSLGYALATLILVAVGVRAMTARMRPMFWAILAGLAVLFAAPAFAPGALREPNASRYVFVGAIMLMLLICEAFHGVAIKRAGPRVAALACFAAVFGFAVYSNATVLDQNAQAWADRGTQVRAELTALDLSQSRVVSTFQPEDPSAQPPVPSTHTGITAKEYFDTERAYGSPAFSPEELRSQPPVDRQVADVVLAHALRLQLRPVPAIHASSQAPRPEVLVTDARVGDSEPSCVRLSHSDGLAGSQIQLAAGGVVLSASGADPVSLVLGRFSGGYGYPLQPVQPGEGGLLLIPRDADQTPWRLLIRPTTQTVRLCGIDLSNFLGNYSQ
jgi:hypothetical protein